MLSYSSSHVLLLLTSLSSCVRLSLAHYNAELFIFTCSSPIDIPVIMCEVGQGFHFPCLFLLFSPSVCSHYILFQQSPIPSLPCCCSPFFCHSFKVSQCRPTIAMSVFLTFFSLHILRIPSLFACFSSSILSTRPAYFNLLLTNF